MKSTNPTDSTLMARVARRDKAALKCLYDRYSAAALGVALKLLGERNTAEEIVQEAFWRVWKRANTYTTQRGEFSTWLFGIVHNLVVDELRRRRSRPPIAFTDWTDDSFRDLPDPKADVAESAASTLMSYHVHAALDQLPENQRKLVELAFFHELTHREIAEKTRQPIGTVHTRIRQALLAMRAQLMPLQLTEN